MAAGSQRGAVPISELDLARKTPKKAQLAVSVGSAVREVDLGQEARVQPGARRPRPEMLERHPKHCINQIQLVERQLPAQRAELAARLRLFGLQQITRAVCNPQKSIYVVGQFWVFFFGVIP